MIRQLSKDSLIVMGASAGGNEAIRKILAALAPDFKAPIVIVLHLPPEGVTLLPTNLASVCPLPVVEASDKYPIQPGQIYCAPPGYHVLVEEDKTLALSVDEPVHFSRPSIDVLFESAARAYRNRVVGILLTGANSDGADGLRMIKDCGGFVIVEDPETALVATMPSAGLEATEVDRILPCDLIGPLLQFASESGGFSIE